MLLAVETKILHVHNDENDSTVSEI